MLYRVFFLSDIFETLITPSILKISSFCKAVMTNQTGQFDDLVRKSAIYEKRIPQIHSKFTQYFACDPKSPDLNPMDFYFWGAAGAEVFLKKSKTIPELKAIVETYASRIPGDTLLRVADNFM